MEGSSTRESIDKRMKGEPSLVLFRCNPKNVRLEINFLFE